MNSWRAVGIRGSSGRLGEQVNAGWQCPPGGNANGAAGGDEAPILPTLAGSKR